MRGIRSRPFGVFRADRARVLWCRSGVRDDQDRQESGSLVAVSRHVADHGRSTPAEAPRRPLPPLHPRGAAKIPIAGMPSGSWQTLRSQEGAYDHCACSRRRCSSASTISSRCSSGRRRRRRTAIRPTTSSRSADRPPDHARGRRVHDGRPADHAGGQPARDPGPPDGRRQGRVFLHRGIAARQFQRAFVLAEGIEVRARGWTTACCTSTLPGRSRRAAGEDHPDRPTADSRRTAMALRRLVDRRRAGADDG